ncbi:pentatricopeptide repeat-containing protein At5g66520-like isoform X2 [Punica granatum]|nr:pentatricopeptide repeat-containing protein At5g66520-like isoform X2 [Punica granatum]
MIRSLVDRTEHSATLSLYKRMVSEAHLLPNNYTFSFLLTACAELTDLCSACTLHCQAIKLGWESYDFVQNGLIHAYAICDALESAHTLFDASKERDVITWTALINGYIKSGQVDSARELFDEMPQRNPVSWSAMINGYVHVGLFREALELFNSMQAISGLRPNHSGIVGALNACALLGSLDHGMRIHAYVDRLQIPLDRMLGSALIDMYAKCGCVEMARDVFEGMPRAERDVFAFTSLISALANHGKSEAAIVLFEQMQREGVVPNEITFICVLNACSRMGLVDRGVSIFRSMREEYRIQPQVQHYGCLVDLLGRAGLLQEAKKVVEEMPMEPDSYVLGALLNACRVHGEIELGRQMVEGLTHRRLDHGGVHVLLSNMYASASQWNCVAQVRQGMEENGVRKVPGCSSIEVNGTVYEFVVGDKSYVFMDKIESLLFRIDTHLKAVDLEEDEEGNVSVG